MFVWDAGSTHTDDRVDRHQACSTYFYLSIFLILISLLHIPTRGKMTDQLPVAEDHLGGQAGGNGPGLARLAKK